MELGKHTVDTEMCCNIISIGVHPMLVIFLLTAVSITLNESGENFGAGKFDVVIVHKMLTRIHGEMESTGMCNVRARASF